MTGRRLRPEVDKAPAPAFPVAAPVLSAEDVDELLVYLHVARLNPEIEWTVEAQIVTYKLERFRDLLGEAGR